MFVPSAAAFLEGGSMIASLAAQEGRQVAENPSLLNDALIAWSVIPLRPA